MKIKTVENIGIVILVGLVLYIMWIVLNIFVVGITCEDSNGIKIQSINNLDDPNCNNIITDNKDILCFCMGGVHIDNNICYKERTPHYFEPIYEFDFKFK